MKLELAKGTRIDIRELTLDKLTMRGQIMLKYGVTLDDADGFNIRVIDRAGGVGGLIVGVIENRYANELTIRTRPLSTAYVRIVSHDGTAYRTSLKIIGGQMEVYSWDGSAEQLVARTSGGYLELARAKLTGDLVPDADATRNLGASTLRFNYVYAATGDFGSLVTVPVLQAGRIETRGGWSTLYIDHRFAGDMLFRTVAADGTTRLARMRIQSGVDDTVIEYTHDNGATWLNAVEKMIIHDDTQVSFTNTTSATIKSFRFYRRGWRNMRLIISAWGDGTNTVYVEVYIDGTLVDSFSTTAASETVFERIIDISGLADRALHTVNINAYVSGGTGYMQFLEAWVW